MRSYLLRCELKTPAPLDKTFSLFENPRNLARLTPPWLGFHVRTPDVEMKKGAIIDYGIHWMGLPLRWRTLISDYAPPYRFVDIQLRGPYTLWRHIHSFHETPTGTVVTDEVRYVLPLGPLGQAAHRILVASQLLEIFVYRQRAMAEWLGGVTEVSPPRIVRAQPLTRRQLAALRFS